MRPLLAYGFGHFTARFDNGVYALRGELVSNNYFETLGVSPAQERVFTEGERGGRCRRDGLYPSAIASGGASSTRRRPW